MKNECFLGIDTSNYTTSLALIDKEGRLLLNLRKLLPVKPGERGLRQSDAVFAHIKNLSLLYPVLREYISDTRILAVGASSRPRNVDGSYMPCFLVGLENAQGIATALNVPVYNFSHQCGHIMSAIYSSGNFSLLDGNSFAAFHLSGGTTELLRVSFNGSGFCITLVGGTKDINAGQLVDRVGVYMGLSFPSGREMEMLASTYDGTIPVKKLSIDDLSVNLSGFENTAKKLYDETVDRALVSSFVFSVISDAVSDLSERYIKKYGDTEFVYAGGVMSNSIIKSNLRNKFRCNFAEPDLSADNAVGIAYLAKLSYGKK